ncbi:glucose repression mediator protein [Coemansia sp. RSA 988]|nr:glucose repression mediator protein [Coemansia sp. RSA 988]
MQAPNHLTQQSPVPAQMRQAMQPMGAGMPPQGMHGASGMGPPAAMGAGQPNGSMGGNTPSRAPVAQSQAHMHRQSRQSLAAQQQAPPPGVHSMGTPQQQQQATMAQQQQAYMAPPSGLSQQQQQQPPPQPQSQGPPPPPSQQQSTTTTQRISAMAEDVWNHIGSLFEVMNEPERALSAYENALSKNPYSAAALTQTANIYRSREDFEKAVEYFQRAVNINNSNGEVWGAIGNCYLMLDELPKAYHAYQQAIIHLPNPKEPKLWYGIGILYDRYGSYDHAEEAFIAVMNMDPGFDKATEIYFRLGIIHKCQGKYTQSLECFNRILSDPPKPLTETDIWFQIGNVHELNSEFGHAKDAYERVLHENPQHAKVLQQLGALYFRPNTSLTNIDMAIQLLTNAIEVDSDKAEAQAWYLLGRCYMIQRQYNKAYEAYQQAVYRDGNNANYWCSIGVLYYQINQYRDALDAYSRAIRINPYLSEVWFDLGALYEACNNQVNDAIDAYTRAAELDRTNAVIEQRLELLRRAQSNGQTSVGNGGALPLPIDPPMVTTTAGQPNAPGGPAGEVMVGGGAPGSLGAPPMSGAPAGAAHSHEQVRLQGNITAQAGGQRTGAPTTPGMTRATAPQYAPQAKPSYSQAPPQHGRAGYPDDAAYSRYDAAQRVDGAGQPAGGGYAPQGAYGAPYTQSPVAQPTPSSRPYPGAGYSQASHAPAAQSLPAGPHRFDGAVGASRQQSPSDAQQSTKAPYSQPAPAAEPQTFQHAPANGYSSYAGQVDVDGPRSRSPSTRQRSPGLRRKHYGQQPMADGGRSEPQDGRRAEITAEPARMVTPAMAYGRRGDRDGDMAMDDAPLALGRAGPLPGTGTPGLKPDSLPHISPGSPLDAAATSTRAHSGPMAAPIRLPPVQHGGAGGLASPTPRTSSGDTMVQAAPVSGRDSHDGTNGPPTGSAPLSLASAISAADEDKEGSAINSLMSLSSVATTLTPRPRASSASLSESPQPSAPKSAAESVTTASGRDAHSEAPAVMNGVKEMEISSPPPDAALLPPASASPADGVPLASVVGAPNGERSHTTSPLASRTALLANQSTPLAGQTAPGDAGAPVPMAPSAGDVAVVPSKRPLAVASDSDATTTAHTAPPRDAPSDDLSSGTADDASSPSTGGAGGGDHGPRKRGRQGSPSPGIRLLPRANGGAGTDEPEDGEVLEEEEDNNDVPQSAANTSHSSRKSEDVVMGSGNVSHE